MVAWGHPPTVGQAKATGGLGWVSEQQGVGEDCGMVSHGRGLWSPGSMLSLSPHPVFTSAKWE